MTRSRTSAAVVALSLGTVAATVIGSGTAVAGERSGFTTTTKPYLVGVPGTGFTTKPLITAGDTVPVTGSPTERYQFVGIPDGLGATTEPAQGRGRSDGRSGGQGGGGDGGAVRVFVNHELPGSVASHPYVNRAQQQGSFVDELLLARDGSVLSGRRAFDQEFQDDTRVDSADSPARSFSRFCSAFMADSRVGMDRPIFVTGEESSSGTFDKNGPQTVAVFTADDGTREIHALSAFGRFAKENTVFAPDTGNLTVAFSTEDGPSGPASQLYMYVGHKQRTGTVLERNGLVGGELYVFAANGHKDESDFQNGTTTGTWKLIPGAADMNAAALDAASVAAGAFGFVRIEDGSFGRSADEFLFVTTGGTPGVNGLGRNYRLAFDARNPLGGQPKLSVIYNADQVDAAGQDIAVSPDNHAAVGRLQAILEDATTQGQAKLAKENRDGSAWLVDGGFTSNAPGQFPQRQRIAELTGSSGGKVDPTPRPYGTWESSGIIPVGGQFGTGDLTFLIDVQAHESAPPNGPTETVEDGQLLLLFRGGNGNQQGGTGRRN